MHKDFLKQCSGHCQCPCTKEDGSTARCRRTSFWDRSKPSKTLNLRGETTKEECDRLIDELSVHYRDFDVEEQEAKAMRLAQLVCCVTCISQKRHLEVVQDTMAVLTAMVASARTAGNIDRTHQAPIVRSAPGRVAPPPPSTPTPAPRHRVASPLPSASAAALGRSRQPETSSSATRSPERSQSPPPSSATFGRSQRTETPTSTHTNHGGSPSPVSSVTFGRSEPPSPVAHSDEESNFSSVNSFQSARSRGSSRSQRPRQATPLPTEKGAVLASGDPRLVSELREQLAEAQSEVKELRKGRQRHIVLRGLVRRCVDMLQEFLNDDGEDNE